MYLGAKNSSKRHKKVVRRWCDFRVYTLHPFPPVLVKDVHNSPSLNASASRDGWLCRQEPAPEENLFVPTRHYPASLTALAHWHRQSQAGPAP